MFSNITTPLIGVVDMAVVGQSADPHLIGAVAIGAQIFTMIFWAFGFLRMGTTGFTAQADGKGDKIEVFAILMRALIIAASAGLLIWVLQWPLSQISFYLIPGSDLVENAAKTYFDIRVWSAPATLANYAILGWFIGLGRADIALALQLLLNGLNIAFDAWFVLGFDWGVTGVAYGTLLSEVIAVAAGLLVSYLIISQKNLSGLWERVVSIKEMTRMLVLNSDIMIRTLCLLLAFVFLTAQSAGVDDNTLAANSVLLGLLSISAYFLDGFAYAAERFVGHSIGAGNRKQFRQAIILSSQWAVFISVLVSLTFAIFGKQIIAAITPAQNVRDIAETYLIWAAMAPVVGVACFQLDGIFIGATRTKDMRNMMLLSLGIYFISWYLLEPVYGNHGLWAAFMLFFVARAVTLAWRLPALETSLRFRTDS
ncbi:MAG: MATE family efflux transporter [Methyloligellaceae bacterium]